MLDLVGLDPDTYPTAISATLRRTAAARRGCSRAGGRSPVLLMDEPFGAVDPITRGLLQDELLRLQAELGKTIVFVTTTSMSGQARDESRCWQPIPHPAVRHPCAILADPPTRPSPVSSARTPRSNSSPDSVRDVELAAARPPPKSDPVETCAPLAGRDWPWR